MTVTLTPAVREQAPLIQNLVQLYTHDFSERWAGSARGDVDAQGRFADYPLDEYWVKPNWSAVLMYRDAALAGFALVNTVAHSGLPVDRNVAEFFVLRKYRGQGVGAEAAQLLFSQWPGVWEAAVARTNQRAATFWRALLTQAAQASAVQELDVNNAHWNGPILRFNWRGPTD